MQVQFMGCRVKGVYRIAKLDLIEAGMDEKVRKCLKILTHWQEFGLKSTIHAFGVGCSTLYAWRNALNEARGNSIALKPQSKRPKTMRPVTWHPMILTEVKRLRQWHPNLGKKKAFAKLVPFCQKHRLPLPSVSTIGRMIGSVPGKMRTSAYRINSKGQRRSISKKKSLANLKDWP
jgi:hypothetical protein